MSTVVIAFGGSSHNCIVKYRLLWWWNEVWEIGEEALVSRLSRLHQFWHEIKINPHLLLTTTITPFHLYNPGINVPIHVIYAWIKWHFHSKFASFWSASNWMIIMVAEAHQPVQVHSVEKLVSNLQRLPDGLWTLRGQFIIHNYWILNGDKNHPSLTHYYWWQW
jgi:hypothetical protein